MGNKVIPKKILYINITNKCQLNCPFCFNKIVDNYQKFGEKPIDADYAYDYIQKLNPDIVNFIGGEPLLYPQTIIDILEKDKGSKRNYCISTNLAYKNITDKQLECLKMIQEQSIEEVSIGTSYNYDRFENKEDYLKLFIDNCNYLDSNGIKIGVTLTITEKQCKEDPYKVVKFLLEDCKASAINIERCIYNDEDAKNSRNELVDLYMCKLFDIIPVYKNYQWNRFYNAVRFRVPVFDNECSKSVHSLYDHGLYDGCPLNNGKHNDISSWLKKLEKYSCHLCEYYPYCRGDCECNRVVCAFPKHTLQYMKNIVKQQEERLQCLIKIRQNYDHYE